MMQIARNVIDVDDGFLGGKRYLIPIITASEIIKDLETVCCSPSPTLARFTTRSDGARDSEGC
jgi:hypothetical protein